MRARMRGPSGLHELRAAPRTRTRKPREGYAGARGAPARHDATRRASLAPLARPAPTVPSLRGAVRKSSPRGNNLI